MALGGDGVVEDWVDRREGQRRMVGGGGLGDMELEGSAVLGGVGVVDRGGDAVGSGFRVDVKGSGDGGLIAIAESPVVGSGSGGRAELELDGKGIGGVGGKGPDVDPGLGADESVEEVDGASAVGFSVGGRGVVANVGADGVEPVETAPGVLAGKGIGSGGVKVDGLVGVDGRGDLGEVVGVELGLGET